METWVLLALATLALWGLWGFFSKIAVKHIKPRHALIYEVIGEAIIGIIVYIAFMPSLPSQLSKSVPGVFAGAIMILGMLVFFVALRKGKASVIVPLTALYPVVAIVLGFLILNESVSIIQGIGIVIALTAAYLLGEEE
jgi:transporter family protein